MDKPVKILSLVPYKFLPPAMGGQKGIAFFNRYLGKQANLTCVTIRENTETDKEPYPILAILDNSKLRYINPSYYFKLKRIIREQQFTHLILEHPYYGWLGMLLKASCNIKLIVHSHNIESLRFKSMGKWWWGILWNYERMTHRKADHSFFINDTDRNHAIADFKLDPARCTTITYGFELNEPPSTGEKNTAREILCSTHQIAGEEKLLLFNGTLGYKPNLEALTVILEKINPLLLKSGTRYRIIICGNKLPAYYDCLAGYKDRNIIYAGFVDDINLYFKGCDIFINPVIEGGGIKTKVVEALGYGLSVVSTESGAVGIPEAITGGKMKIIKDNDWDAFAHAVMSMNADLETPDAFYEHFYWGNIAAIAAERLSKV